MFMLHYSRCRSFLALTISLLLLTISAVSLAQTSTDFHLEWISIGSGGGESASAGYVINGTIGQGVASRPVAASADFQVSSGYWFPAVPAISPEPSEQIYLPLITR